MPGQSAEPEITDDHVYQEVYDVTASDADAGVSPYAPYDVIRAPHGYAENGILVPVSSQPPSQTADDRDAQYLIANAAPEMGDDYRMYTLGASVTPPGGISHHLYHHHSQQRARASKRKRVISFDQRKAANIRERRRMLSLNDAFDLLRRALPTFSYEKKLSRIETLRLALTYMAFMMDVLNGADPKDVRLLPARPAPPAVRRPPPGTAAHTAPYMYYM